MANALFTIGKQGILDRTIDMVTGNLKCALMNLALDTPSLTTDDNLDDILAGVVATSGNLGAKTFVGGLFDAADNTFGVVASGAVCGAIVVYLDTGVSSTSRLIYYIDQGTRLPVTPNGTELVLSWNASGIFRI